MPRNHIRIGILVPSSNTAVEPLISAITSTVNAQISSVHITSHFSRFAVTQISLTDTARSQFDLHAMLAAASLLADAKVDAISWGGTSAGWLGLDTDVKLCEAIETQFGIPACTSTLALVECLHLMGDPEVGLVTPYIAEMNAAIRGTFGSAGIMIAEDDRYLGITDNHEIGEVDGEKLSGMVDEVLAARDDLGVIMIFCTNLSGAQLAPVWEEKYKGRRLMVLDSVSAVVWGLLRKVGISTQGTEIAREWGKMFDLPIPSAR